jgi:predicted nicotinamide N-methyase
MTTRLAFVPELRLRVAPALLPLWDAVQKRSGGVLPVPPPFWAFAWPGSLAFARYLFDHPELVAGRRVYDFAAGSGLAGIAAARVGAAEVVTCDLDPLAAVAQRLNARLNGVALDDTRTGDPVGGEYVDHDVVLAGDVCYEREPARQITAWLRNLARTGPGRLVLLADPGRAYAPQDGVELLAAYDVPTNLELESEERLRTTVCKILPA